MFSKSRKHAHRKNLEAFQYAKASEFAPASYLGGQIEVWGLFYEYTSDTFSNLSKHILQVK